MRSDKRLYLTTDRSRVVEEGDPDAGFLMVNEGGDVPAEHLDMYREYRKANEAEERAAAKSERVDAKDMRADAKAERQAGKPEDDEEPKPEEMPVGEKSVEKPPENKARMMGEKK